MSVFKGKIMQRKTCTGIKLATLLTVIAACQDNTVAPDPVMQEQRLTAEEAADIAEQAVDVIDWVLDGETDANPLLVPADRSSDLALTMSRVPVTRKFSWTREHECWGGGTFHARGAGTKTGDRDTGELTIEYEGGKVITTAHDHEEPKIVIAKRQRCSSQSMAEEVSQAIGTKLKVVSKGSKPMMPPVPSTGSSMMTARAHAPTNSMSSGILRPIRRQLKAICAIGRSTGPLRVRSGRAEKRNDRRKVTLVVNSRF